MRSKVLNMKVLVVVLMAVFTIAVFAKLSGDNDKFSQAKDFPKGALVYVQVTDLPKLFEIWNDSKLKKNYLKSVNYNEFKNRHLALKIAERWSEFNLAFAMPIGSGTFASLSETKAAIAVYDIGKLDFVFISPMSNEKILASYFFQNLRGFEENHLEDGNVFYSKEIEVDRGRQKQKLLFMNLKGRLVFATNEALFFQTVANLNSNSKDGNLADESEFKELAERSETHLATVWVNQTKLNNNYYFKHYWLMGNVEKLNEIRAGMFDFELGENELVEHRLFLRSKNPKDRKEVLNTEKLASLRQMIPKDIPYFKIKSIDKKDSMRKLLRRTLLDNYSIPKTPKTRKNNTYYYDDFDYDPNYSYLDNDFDKQINDAEDAGIVDDKSSKDSFRTDVETKLLTEFQGALNQAKPNVTAYLVNPQKMANPLFLKTQKALIFSVQNKNGLNTKALESSISKLLQNRLTVADTVAKFNWKTKEKDNYSWREISTPFLDWNFYYAIKNSEIIFANDAEFLLKILKNENETLNAKGGRKLSEFEVINFDQREQVFDDVMKNLIRQKPSDERSNNFFVNNVGSLLDVLGDVQSVEIERLDVEKFFGEEIIYRLRVAE